MSKPKLPEPKHILMDDLTAWESVAIALVGILSIAAGVVQAEVLLA